MPLYLGEDGNWNEITDATTGGQILQIIYGSEKYRASATEFCNLPVRKISSANSIYVGQRECAVVPRQHAEDGFAIVGSDDATTCHILILHHRDSGTAAVAHFDDVDPSGQMKTFLKTAVNVLDDIGARRSSDVKPLSFDAYLVGGFNDSRSMSEALSGDLLWLLHAQPSSVAPPAIGPIDVCLKLACISSLNTVQGPNGQQQVDDHTKPWPAAFGAAIDLQTGEVFQCTFEERGPEAPLRSARHFSDESDLLNIYSHKNKRLVIGPFHYYTIGHAKTILSLPDEWILQNMSTSPMVEPPHFAEAVRNMIKFTLQNPDWRDVFANGPIEYEKRAGQGWTRVT